MYRSDQNEPTEISYVTFLTVWDSVGWKAKGLDTAAWDSAVRQLSDWTPSLTPLPLDSVPSSLTSTCHLEAEAAYQMAPFGGLVWRAPSPDRVEPNRVDSDSREPLALLLTLTHTHVHKHTRLWSVDKHTWTPDTTESALFISSPAVFFLSLSLIPFFLMNSLQGAGFLTAAFVFLHFYEV